MPTRTQCKTRLKSAIESMNKTHAAARTARMEYRYATNNNGGWATPKEARRLYTKAQAAGAKARKAKLKFERVLRTCERPT